MLLGGVASKTVAFMPLRRRKSPAGMTATRSTSYAGICRELLEHWQLLPNFARSPMGASDRSLLPLGPIRAPLEPPHYFLARTRLPT